VDKEDRGKILACAGDRKNITCKVRNLKRFALKIYREFSFWRCGSNNVDFKVFSLLSCENERGLSDRQYACLSVCLYVISNNFKTNWYIFMKLSMQVMKLKATSFYLSMPSAERENPVWDVRSEI
jgi:hypothetical protein